MFEKNSVRRFLVAAILCATPVAGPVLGQETKKGGSVPITFVPPPLENATYSVGIYDVKTGKLARRLCEAAGQGTFKIGLNGLITSWDGKDDDGKPLPPGKYAARGYAVGPLKVEGEAILGNDWAGDDDDLRITRVSAIGLVPEDDGLVAMGETTNGSDVLVRMSGKDGTLLWKKALPFASTNRRPHPGGTIFVDGDVVTLTIVGETYNYRLASGEVRASSAVGTATSQNDRTSLGKNESVWKIEDDVLSQHSLKGDVQRSLGPKEGDPLPVAVVASTKSERLYLLEKKENWQRVRGLAWVETKEENGKPVSTWQTFFERNIRPTDPVMGLGDAAVEIPLADNPLAPGKRENVKLTATFDEKGSYLSIADGLRLRQVSQRSALRAVKLAQDKAGDGLAFFQTDGAAWDQFSIKGVKEIVSFDAGEFEIDSTGEKPNAEKAPEPDL